MSGYQGYPQGRWPGGDDEGRAWASGRTAGQSGRIQSMAEFVSMSRVVPGGSKTYKRLAPNSREDFCGVPSAKKSRSQRGGLPVKDQSQESDWKFGMIDEADKPRTLFVFNLVPNTRGSDLFNYFIKFGDLMKFDILTNDEGKCMGKGIMQFVNEEAAVTALAAQPHFIYKKQVLLSHDHRDDPKSNPRIRKSLERHKLYVSNIPLYVSEEDLCKYFSQWGNISFCNLVENAQRTKKAKFIFLSYTKKEDAVKCLNTTHSCGQNVICVHVAQKCIALKDVVKEVRNNGDDGRQEVNKLFVCNIHDEITAEELSNHFSMWGELYVCKIIGNVKHNNKYGFVQYKEQEDALTALIMPHTLKNQRIFASVADKKGGPLLEASKDPMIMSAIEQKVQKCFLYVRDLNPMIPRDELYEHFKTYGDLASFMVKPSGSQLFAFMAYVREVDAARCYHDSHFLNNMTLTVYWSDLTKWAVKETKAFIWQKSDAQASEPARPANPHVQASPANPPKDARSPRQAEPARSVDLARSVYPVPKNAEPLSRKLEISGLAADTRAYKLKCYFSKWGKVEDFEVVKDARSRPTGCAFVIFEKQCDAEKAVSDKPHVIDDKEVEVTLAMSQKVRPNRKLSVSGLAVHTRDYKLLWYFSTWGPVVDVDLVMDEKMRPTGCAFVLFENQRDAEKAVSHKPHIIDEEKVEVTFAKPHENLPSETVPSRREQEPCETVQKQKVVEDSQLQGLHEDAQPRKLREYAQPRKLREVAQPRKLREVAQPHWLHEYAQPRRMLEGAQSRRLIQDAQQRSLLEDAKPRRLREDAQPRRMREDAQPRRLLEESQPQRLPEVNQPRRQSTPEPLIPDLKQVGSYPDMPLVTEYECNVSGCSFKGKSEQFERHWTKIHEAKVLYFICSFCTMGCVDADDLREHLDFFHGIEDKSALSTFVLGARQQERDNIHFVMPGSVTRETCMKGIKPARKKDAKDVHNCPECTFTGSVDDFVDHWAIHHSTGLNFLKCPKCPRKLVKKRALVLHIKNMHPNIEMRTEEKTDKVKDNFGESQNFGSSHTYHDLPRSNTDISNIRSGSARNTSIQTLPRASLSAPLQSEQRLPRPQLPILPYQQPTPPIPPLLASQVPTQQLEQAVPLHGQVTPFYPSRTSVPKPVQPHLTPPPLPPPVLRPAPQDAEGCHSYSPTYPQLPVLGTLNTSTQQQVMVALKPALSTQSNIVPVVSYSQVPFQPQVSAQLKQACIVASPHTQVVASVPPSVVPPPQAGAPLQLPLTGQVNTQSASAESPEFVLEQPPVASVAPSVVPPTSSHAGAPLQLPLTGQVNTQSASVQPPEFVMEQPPVASKSVVMPGEDPRSMPELDNQDLHDFNMDNIKTQEKEKSPKSGMVTKMITNDELKRSVQPGSVVALRPEWTKAAHPIKPSLDKNTTEEKRSFTAKMKFIPKFDKTDPDSIQKFLLWSHIMMERLEEANIKLRRRLKADDGEGDIAEGDDDEDPEEMLQLSSNEATGGGKSTAVKGTFSQAQEDMKARAQTIAQKVVADYRSTNRYTKGTAVSVTSNKGHSGKGVGKQRMLDRKVFGQLFHKSIGMIRSQSKTANVDADLVRQGITWVKQHIRRILDDHSQSFQQGTDKGERSKKGRRGNSDQSRKEHQQRTEKRLQSRDKCQHKTDNHGRVSEHLQQRTGNIDRSRKERQQRTGKCELSRGKHQHRTENFGRRREEIPDRREWKVENKEPVEVYMDEYVNEDEEYALAYVDEDGVHVMDDGFKMSEGGHVERAERMDEETKEYLEYSDDDRTSFSFRLRRNEDRRSQRFENQMPRKSVFVTEDEYFDEGNESFVEQENEELIHSERVVEVVNYDEHEGTFDTAWSESAEQDSRILPGQESSFGRVGRRLDRDRRLSNQRDSFETNKSVTRRSRGQGSRAHSESSSEDKSVKWRGKERNRGRETPEHTEHFRKDNSVKRDQKDFVDGGSTKSQKKRSKQIDSRDYHRNMKNQSSRDKSSSSKTKCQYLKKEGLNSKTKDQISSGKKNERKGGDNTARKEGNTFECELDDINEGALSGDGSLCEFDMDDIDMGDFVVMDEV